MTAPSATRFCWAGLLIALSPATLYVMLKDLPTPYGAAAIFAATAIVFAVVFGRSRRSIHVAHELVAGRMARRLAQVEAVSEANAAVSDALAGVATSSLRDVLQAVAARARTLTSAGYAAAGIGTDPERPFDPWVFLGIDAGRAAAIGPPPRPRGLLGLVATGERSVRIRDADRHPAAGGLPPNHPALTSFLGVPIRHRGHTVGNLYLANKLGGDEFTEHDQRIVEMLADRVGAAIEASRLYRAEGLERAWLQAVITISCSRSARSPSPARSCSAAGRCRPSRGRWSSKSTARRSGCAG